MPTGKDIVITHQYSKQAPLNLRISKLMQMLSHCVRNWLIRGSVGFVAGWQATP